MANSEKYTIQTERITFTKLCKCSEQPKQIQCSAKKKNLKTLKCSAKRNVPNIVHIFSITDIYINQICRWGSSKRTLTEDDLLSMSQEDLILNVSYISRNDHINVKLLVTYF